MITVAIPTYNRGAILVETLEHLRALRPPEILVVDQTKDAHELPGARVIRLPEPSIPHAMNVALENASNEIVLFLDDDLIPSPELLAEHLAAHEDDRVWAVVGQVLQPGQESTHVEQWPSTTVPDLAFPFHSDTPRNVENVMAGNLSVKRTRALSIGGFDENFFGVAYRFETDFARRIVDAGGIIRFAPKASIRHLQIPTGGVRAYGDHRRSASPAHSIGDYYFGRLHAPSFPRYAAARLRQNVLTRYHLTHPWFLPAKLLGELRGLLGSARLVRAGRKLRNKASTG
jgi:GT2 family glycosyltransferase